MNAQFKLVNGRFIYSKADKDMVDLTDANCMGQIVAGSIFVFTKPLEECVVN